MTENETTNQAVQMRNRRRQRMELEAFASIVEILRPLNQEQRERLIKAAFAIVKDDEKANQD